MSVRRSAARARRPVDLALQGGGAHGAFTWGVLDRLLEERSLVIAGVSGTSAGAMNAVALASGLMEGGRDGARAALRRLWERVARMAPWDDGGRVASHAAGAGEADAPGLSSAWLAPWAGPVRAWAELWTAPSQAWTQGVHAWWSDSIARTWSPYQLNPLNPLELPVAPARVGAGGRRPLA